jgi:hypothetical protein
VSTEAKRRAIAIVVAAVALWPAAHFALARHTGFDPWELFGWAMYAVPASRVQVGFERIHPDGSSEPLSTAGPLRRRVQDFARLRATLGSWASPDPIVRELLEDDPSLERVTVVVRVWRLELDSARLATRDQRLRYERGVDGPVRREESRSADGSFRRPGS